MGIETYIINHTFHVAMAQVPIPITETIYLSFDYIDIFHGQNFYLSTILIYFISYW